MTSTGHGLSLEASNLGGSFYSRRQWGLRILKVIVTFRWSKYWGFSFIISHCNEYSELIFFKIDCPKDSQEPSAAPQLEGINSSASVFFIVQLSHLYMTTGKTIALTIQTFVRIVKAELTVKAGIMKEKM